MAANNTVIMRFESSILFTTIPVNPASIRISTAISNEHTNVIGLGEIVVPGSAGLRRFTVASFFPADQAPEGKVSFFTQWQQSGKPARFTVTGLGIDMVVILESFSFERRAGEEGDIYYELAVSEFQPYGVKILIPAADDTAIESPPERVEDAPPVGQNYTVVSGDCLWSIAARFSSQGGADWRRIYDIPANREVIGDNPNLLYPGQVLIIPPEWVTASPGGSGERVVRIRPAS